MNTPILAAVDAPFVTSVILALPSIAFAGIALIFSKNANKLVAQQAATARRSLALGMYERRLNIYRATKRLLNFTSRDLKVSIAEVHIFLNETDDIEFILPADVVAYVNSVRQVAYELRGNMLKIENATSAEQMEERKRLNDIDAQLTARFVAIMQRDKEPFKKCLDFSDILADGSY